MPTKTHWRNAAGQIYRTTYAGQEHCACPIHRYHVAHLCECGILYSHRQSECDEHRGHACVNFEPDAYMHGWTAREMFDDLMVKGALPLGTSACEKVCDFFAQEEATR